MAYFTGIDRDLLIAAEGTWGVSAGGALATPISGDGIQTGVQAAFYEPSVNILLHNTAQIPLSRIPRGSIVCHLHKDSALQVLQMGITRGAASLGAPLGSYTITDLNRSGSRVWLGAMSSRMTLSVDRRSGAVSVSHDVVAKSEGAGQAWSAQDYSSDSVVSAKNISLNLGNGEPVWENFSLTVENRLIEGPPFGTAGTLTSCLAGRQRGSFTGTVWVEDSSAFTARLRDYTPSEVVITIIVPDGETRIITLPQLYLTAAPIGGDSDSAQRFNLSGVVGKPTSGDGVQLT